LWGGATPPRARAKATRDEVTTDALHSIIAASNSFINANEQNDNGIDMDFIYDHFVNPIEAVVLIECLEEPKRRSYNTIVRNVRKNNRPMPESILRTLSVLGIRARQVEVTRDDTKVNLIEVIVPE